MTLSLVLAMCGCSTHRTNPSELINKEASLTGNLLFQPLRWRVITSAINKQDSTMSTLYGNDLAVNCARTNASCSYPSGSVLSLVTWSQKADEHWFGARIPAQVKSVEFIVVNSAASGEPSYSYEDYAGTPLAKLPPQESAAVKARVRSMLDQRASVMP
jgi:hypothetical protein